MICNKCGGTVPDTDKFCTFCGNDLAKQREEEAAQKAAAAAQVNAAPETPVTPAEDMKFHCPNCGAEIQPGDKFCITCGAPVVAGPQGETPVPVDANPQEVPAQQSAANQEQSFAPQEQNANYDPNYAMQGQSNPYQAKNQGFDPNQQYSQQGTFYAQQNPNYQQQQPMQEKKKSKTPAWVWLVIALLVVGIVFCIIWFFVLPKSSNNNQAGNQNNAVVSNTETGDASGNGVAVNNAPAREYVNENSDYSGDAVSKLETRAVEIIRGQINKKWRHPEMATNVTDADYGWNGNSFVVIVEVDIDPSLNPDGYTNVNYTTYYTYVKFNNVYRKGSTYYCTSTEYPKKYTLNLFDDPGSQHKVAGYAYEEDAEAAAGIG